MATLGITFALLTLAALINVIALVESRSGTTPKHLRLFASGVAGLIFMPIFIGSVLLMAMSFIDVSSKSAQGFLFIVSGIGLVAATVTSFALQFAGRGSRSHV
nr:putative integron gene cassette protein [uncultured bacterium]CAP48958.1 putative integron gene cassette protein [uncultured bacterium]